MIIVSIYLIKNMKSTSTLLLLIIILFCQWKLFLSCEEYLYNLKRIIFNGFQVKYYIFYLLESYLFIYSSINERYLMFFFF